MTTARFKEGGLRVIRDSRAVMLTFGGKTVWTAKAGTAFSYDILLERNAAFTVIQSGLNFYVLETSAMEEA